MAKETFSSSPPPLTPPLTEEDRLDWLRLLRSRRVGVATFHRLLSETGSATAALDALPDLARSAGVRGYAVESVERVRAEYDAGRQIGARLVALPDPDYPAALADLPDAPPLLWSIGNPALLSRPLVAIVGARNASSLGLRMARRLSAELAAAGVVVVSGLARGIDTEAHKAALAGGTVAVVAGGVDVVYPPENADLQDRIGRDGLILSEQPIHATPQARHFPARNRIVSGLARAVIVVEAAAKSGSLITARMALDQGREVLAVPGHPFDARAAGCNILIRDGARLVRGARDVLDALGPIETAAVPRPEASRLPPPQRHGGTDREAASRPGPAAHAPIDRVILDRLGPSPTAEDQLIRDLDRPAAEVAAALVVLEMDGAVQRHPGGLLSRL